MNIRNISGLLVLSLAVIALSGSTSFAATTPPPVDHTASAAAQQNLAVAQAAYDKAKTTFNNAIVNLKRDFEASKEYTGALADLKQAQVAYDSVREPVIKALEAKPEYITAKAAKERADQTVATLREASTSGDQMQSAAKDAMDAGKAVTSMEADALNADPRVSEAKGKVVAAGTKASGLRSEFETSLKTNAAVTKAKADIEAANQKVIKAQTVLAAAQQKENQAETSRDQKIDDAEAKRQEELKKQLYRGTKTGTNLR